VGIQQLIIIIAYKKNNLFLNNSKSQGEKRTFK
jgi:hypothetical protein